ncbi:hypothetical protein LCGC14_1897650 [marine sediment metagenome]|uniref:Uncharacterized protein n=1 Tax=marine sediment metagenome TaxID=412755 RepID=A0A0F9IBD7_9ZZZZ
MKIKVLVWEERLRRVTLTVDVLDPNDPVTTEEEVVAAALALSDDAWEIASTEGINFKVIE